MADISLGLSFDDVLLLPGHTDVIPSDADTRSQLTRRIDVATPLLPAEAKAAKTATGASVTISMGVSCCP